MPPTSPENAPDEPLESPATLRLLRGLGTEFDPLLQRLAERLGAPDAEAWVVSLESAKSSQGPLEDLVREALHRAALAAAGGGNAMVGIDPMLLQEAWALLLERVPSVAGAVPAAMAAIHDEHAVAGVPGSLASAPQILGGYELLDVLGEGAFGTVFRGRHADNGALAAVKVLRAASQSTALVTRFRLEAKLVAQLVHPAIVAVRDSGVERHAGLATPYIVYELVEGRPFREALTGASTDQVLVTFAEVCEAIEYAHRCGILHRDIKSANVLVDAAFHAHVLDFGVARPEVDSDLRMTRTGEILGTPSSMSPEQASGRGVDARSDIYSLGALLFEALAGELPHPLHGMGGQQALVVVASSPVRSLASVCPKASADLIAVVDTALAFSAVDRYPTVAALLADVGRLRAGRPVSVSRPSAWHVLRMFARRNKRIAAMVCLFGCVALVTVTALFVAWRQSVDSVAVTKRAEGVALEASARNLRSMRLLVQGYGPLVEAYPSTGEQYDNLVGLLEKAIHEAAGGDLPAVADAESLQMLASLHELAGDLAFRGKRLVACRTYREATAALLERAMARGGAFALEHARAQVKLGDLELEASPGRAKVFYERAHAVFEAAGVGAQADVVALDELGWSYERLASLAWRSQRRVEAFALAKQRVAFVATLAERHPDAARQYHLASALATLCVYAGERPGDSGIGLQERLGLARRASEAAQAAVAQHPIRRPYQDLASKASTYFGRACLDVGDRSAAKDAFERAVGYAAGLVASDPGSTLAQSLEVLAHQDLALCLVGIGDLGAAEQENLMAAKLCERIVLLGGEEGVSEQTVAHFRSVAQGLAAQRRMQEAAAGSSGR